MLDVIIIGGGVIGCAIARRLSGYKGSFALVEAKADVAMGASGANSGIVHAGFDCEPGSMMAKMNVEGNRLYDTWARELDVPLTRLGALVVAFSAEGIEHIEALKRNGVENGVPGLEIWDGDKVRTEDENLSEEIVAALYAPSCGIVCPYEMTVACAENAAQNGVEFHLNWPVDAIETDQEGFILRSGERTLKARYIVNAAGAYADEIGAMIGDTSLSITPRRGEYTLFDKNAGGLVKHVIFQTPGPMGKGVLVSPTVDGNVFIGPSASEQTDKEQTPTTAQGQGFIRQQAQRSVPNLPLGQSIRTFAGLRAVEKGNDFVLRASEVDSRMILAAGMCSPGLSSAPAVADYMLTLLENAGLALTYKPEFVPVRKRAQPFRLMTNDQREKAIRQDERYGHIICRCEMISEAEIVHAVRSNPPALTVDGVKRRTRGGMGRCQGGFCAPRVMEIIARERNIPLSDVTKFGGGSYMVLPQKEDAGHENRAGI